MSVTNEPDWTFLNKYYKNTRDRNFAALYCIMMNIIVY